MTWVGLVQRNGKYNSTGRIIVWSHGIREYQTGIFGRKESAHKLSMIDSNPWKIISFCSGIFRVDNASLAVQKYRTYRERVLTRNSDSWILVGQQEFYSV